MKAKATKKPAKAPKVSLKDFVVERAKSVISPQNLGRPVIIDENDGPCDICANHKNGSCDSCGLDGSKSGLMCGVYSDNTKHVGMNGFQSPKPSHFHLTAIEGINGRRAYWAELCYDCYKAEYLRVHGKDPFAQ